MARDVSEITEALKEAAEGKSDSSDGPVKEEVEATPPVTPEVTPQSTPEPKAAKEDDPKDQRVPYDRFKEVNEKAKTLEEQLESMQTKLTDRDEEVGKLVDLLEAREYHSKVIDKINELHGDPRYTDIIDTLDKAIRGVEQEVESGKVSEEEGAAKTDQAFKNLAEDLEERLADNQAELLLTKYDLMMEKYIDGLPEEYIDKDKELVNRLAVDEIDWESIEENPEALADKVAEGFQKALDLYGDPKGKTAAPQNDEPSETPAKPEPTVEQIAGLNWGTLKEVNTPDGKTVHAPAVSDEEFNRAMADVIKRTREG